MDSTGSPVEYSSYDVTYAAGCRERVTRPSWLHGIIKKIETGEATVVRKSGGEEKRGDKKERAGFLGSSSIP